MNGRTRNSEVVGVVGELGTKEVNENGEHLVYIFAEKR